MTRVRGNTGSLIFMNNLWKARIATFSAIGGVIFTAVQATKDHEKARLRLYDKAQEFQRPLTRTEKVVAGAPSYIPTYISAGATILAILASSHFHVKHEAVLSSAIALGDRLYSEYMSAVDQATDEIAKGHILEKKSRPTTHDPEKQCWYIDFHDAIFEATESDILKAQLTINKELATTGGTCINRFLEELGLPKTKYGDIMGWDFSTNLEPWIDLNLSYFEVDDMEVMGIQFVPRPWVDNCFFPTDE